MSAPGLYVIVDTLSCLEVFPFGSRSGDPTWVGDVLELVGPARECTCCPEVIPSAAFLARAKGDKTCRWRTRRENLVPLEDPDAEIAEQRQEVSA